MSQINFDPSVTYNGPMADFATITGTPWWGLKREEIIHAAEKRGWHSMGGRRIPTPYGLGPYVHHLVTPDGRNVIWIPSYGWILGQDWIERRPSERLFWILWQAGVKVLVVGGTSGVADWRENGERVKPGDIVFPWSFRTKPFHRGLIGTSFECAWPRNDLLLDNPFCPLLCEQMIQVIGNLRGSMFHGSVHSPNDVRAAIVHPDGITFETDYDILRHLALSKMISQLQPDLPPLITIHGDCENPVLARFLGIHVLYYHTIGNVVQGLEADEEISDSLYQQLQGNFNHVTLEMELSFFETAQMPDEKNCCCASSLKKAPEVFQELYTWDEEE